MRLKKKNKTVFLEWTQNFLVCSRSETRSSLSGGRDGQRSIRPEPVPAVRSGLLLRPEVHPAAGPRPGSGLRLRRDGAVQVLRRGVPPHHLQPRPDPGQPAAQRRAARGAVAPHALLQAQPPRGHGLSGQLPPLAQGGAAVGRRLQLRGLTGGWWWGGGSGPASLSFNFTKIKAMN